MSDKRILDDNLLEEVVGGTLNLVARNGVGTLNQKDVNNNIIGTYAVTDGNLRNVADMLKGPYWNFEAGKRDEQCLAYMKAKGWIR